MAYDLFDSDQVGIKTVVKDGCEGYDIANMTPAQIIQKIQDITGCKPKMLDYECLGWELNFKYLFQVGRETYSISGSGYHCGKIYLRRGRIE